MATKSGCGAHKELGAAHTLRVTQCPCGTIHLHLRSGVSVRLTAQEFADVAGAVAAARGALAAADADPVDGPHKPAVN